LCTIREVFTPGIIQERHIGEKEIRPRRTPELLVGRV